MIPMNTYPASSVVPIPFTTYATATGASITMTGLAVTDIEIYKGTSMTQRSSDAGFTLLDTDGIDIDGVTGFHGFSIDLGDNTDAGFYAVGSFYTVVVSAVTVDGQTVTFIADRFRIVPAEGIAGHPKVDVGGWLGTAPATPTVAGVPEVDLTHVAGTAATAAAGIPEVKVASIATNAVTAAAVADGTLDAATFAADTNVYTATCHLTDKNSATATDRYSVKWFKNGAWITSGITSPTIKVVQYSDGAELFAATALSAVTGFDGLLKKDITATLAARGAAYEAVLVATIDGSSRTFPATVTRDVSA